MRFRPCIDIHNGKVKQIVGGSLTDDGRGTARISFPIRTRHIMPVYMRNTLLRAGI